MKRYRRLIKRLIILFVLIFVVKIGFNNVNKVNNPSDIMVLVNYQNQISLDYKPNDLVVPNIKYTFTGDDPKKQMRKVAAFAIEDMFDEAKAEGILLYGVSGYRSSDRQTRIFNDRVAAVGEIKAKQYVALPGESEHQTGLAMDIGNLDSNFGQSEEGKWLRENSYRFGFILRYPEDKEHITKINYEPWHFRYVGVKPATEIHESGLTLEEYLGDTKAYEKGLKLVMDIPARIVRDSSRIWTKIKANGIFNIS